MVKQSKHIVDMGWQLGRSVCISTNVVENHTNLLNGYIIVETESQEQAVILYINYPHFIIFQGESIDLFECTVIPSFYTHRSLFSFV